MRTLHTLTVLTAALASVLVSTRPAAAQPAGDEREMVEKVNRAIDRGVQFLKASHHPTNHWENLTLNVLADMNGGVTALATLALLNCGEKPEDRVVAAALRYLRGLPNSKTYVVGLSTMAFAEARQKIDEPRIQANVDWLLKNAIYENGKLMGWSYPFGPGAQPDGSNTQYALLGLYAGKQAGAKIDSERWKQIRQLYMSTHIKEGADSGYWIYMDRRVDKPSFTMTVAGVSGLLIAGMGLEESQQQLDPATGVAARCGVYDLSDPLHRGMNWIGKNFSFANAPDAKSVYYNVYGIERVGRLSGQRFLGRIDWYREGCKFLIREQRPDTGAWEISKGSPIDGVRSISTSFALLFLSKGRSPVLISKLAYGEFTLPQNGVLVERGDAPGIVGWNRKHNDARHLTEFASRELFNGLPLGWQVYDPRRQEFNREADILEEVGVLVQSPILYLNGHKAPVLRDQQKQLLKRYIEEGGFVLAEACCGSPEFAEGFRALMKELFPDSKLDTMPPNHAIWRSYFAVPPTTFPKLESLDRGCRTVVVLSPEPLAGYWEEAKYMAPKDKADANRGEQAFRLGGNIIAYATGMEPPKQRLTLRRIVDASKKDLSPPRGFVKPAQIRLRDEAPPAPAAMRNLMAHVRDVAHIDVVLEKESMFPADDELFKYKFLYLHGRKKFDWNDDEIENVKANLQAGGLLFADACCGKPEFDAAFRALVAKMYPGQKLEVIDANDDLYSAKLNGAPILSVKRREKSDGAGGDGGFKDMPPFLEGIKIDGRWAVIYSKYDVGCALEGHKSTDCRGHDRDSALRIGTAALLYALKQ